MNALIQSIFAIILITTLAGLVYPYLLPGAKQLVARSSLLRPFAVSLIIIVGAITVAERLGGGTPSTIGMIFSLVALVLLSLEVRTLHGGTPLQQQQRVIERAMVGILVLFGIRAVIPETLFAVGVSFAVSAAYSWVALEAINYYRSHRRSINLAIVAVCSGIATVAMAARANEFLSVVRTDSASFTEPAAAFLARSIAAACTVVIFLFLNQESLSRLTQAKQETVDNLNRGLLHSLTQILQKRTGTPDHLAQLQNTCASLLAEKLTKVWWADIRHHKDLPSILRQCAVLADIGLIGMPDSVDTRDKAVGSIPLIGENLFRSIARQKSNGRRRGQQTGLFQVAADIAGNHCERWDGSGTPNGKQGREIPASARIVAAARAYIDLKLAHHAAPVRRPVSEALHRLRGTSLDPFVVDVLLASEAEFAALIDDTRKAAA